MRYGIRSKALTFLVAIPLALIASLAAMLFVLQFKKDLGQAQAMLGAATVSMRDAVRLEISKGYEYLRSIASAPQTARVVSRMSSVPESLDNDDYAGLPEFAELRAKLDATSKGTTLDLVYVASTGSSGLILGRDVQLVKGFDVRGRDYYKAAIASPGTPVMSEPRVSAEKSDTPIIVITGARSVEDSTGTTVGIAAFNYRLTPIIDIVKKQIDIHGVNISLFDTVGGYLLWHRFADREYYYDPKKVEPMADLLKGMGYRGDPAAILAGAASPEAKYLEAGSGRGSLMLETVGIPETRWALLVSFPRSALVADVMGAIVPPLGVFLVVFLVAQLAIYVGTMRGMVRPLIAVGQRLEALAEADADLTVALPVASKDEIGQVAVSFNRFMGNLRGLMADVTAVIAKTSEVRRTVAESTDGTSSSVEEISANIASIRSQIETLDATIKDNIAEIERMTSNIGQVDERISSQSEMVERSTAAITQMMASLGSVNAIAQTKRRTTEALAAVAGEGMEKIAKTASTFKTVVGHIAKVQEMATTINSIAAQTNLLSMNAAIEAAHAGDSGRGFAVVAEEIRKLADSAGTSSQSIAALIKGISSSVKETDEHVGSTSLAFERIREEVGSTVNAFSEIESAVSELNIGGQQILESTNEINERTVGIREGSRELKSGTESLLASSARIKEISDRVTTGMAEAATGSSEIVESMQALVHQSHNLGEIVDELTEKFGRFKT